MKQRDMMRSLYQAIGNDEQALISNYADSERSGKVVRGSNSLHLSPEQYARALYLDGIRKGWIKEEPTK